MIHSTRRGLFWVSSYDHALVDVLTILKQGGACLCVLKVLNFAIIAAQGIYLHR